MGCEGGVEHLASCEIGDWPTCGGSAHRHHDGRQLGPDSGRDETILVAPCSLLLRESRRRAIVIDVKRREFLPTRVSSACEQLCVRAAAHV